MVAYFVTSKIKAVNLESHFVDWAYSTLLPHTNMDYAPLYKESAWWKSRKNCEIQEELWETEHST